MYSIYVSQIPAKWSFDFYCSYKTLGEAEAIAKRLRLKYKFVEIRLF